MCRHFGIFRWPYRRVPISILYCAAQIKLVNKQIAFLKRECNPETAFETISELQEKRKVLQTGKDCVKIKLEIPSASTRVLKFSLLKLLNPYLTLMRKTSGT